MASFKTKFLVLQELFAKNHGGPLGPQRVEGYINLGVYGLLLYDTCSNV